MDTYPAPCFKLAPCVFSDSSSSAVFVIFHCLASDVAGHNPAQAFRLRTQSRSQIAAPPRAGLALSNVTSPVSPPGNTRCTLCGPSTNQIVSVTFAGQSTRSMPCPSDKSRTQTGAVAAPRTSDLAEITETSVSHDAKNRNN